MPFTRDQFFDVFLNYNLAVWPMQGFLNLLAALAVLLTFWKIRHSDAIIAFILFVFWSWMGVAYHILFFSSINKAAYLFGVLFLAQGLLFLWFGVIHKAISFQFPRGIWGVFGGFLIL